MAVCIYSMDGSSFCVFFCEICQVKEISQEFFTVSMPTLLSQFSLWVFRVYYWEMLGLKFFVNIPMLWKVSWLDFYMLVFFSNYWFIWYSFFLRLLIVLVVFIYVQIYSWFILCWIMCISCLLSSLLYLSLGPRTCLFVCLFWCLKFEINFANNMIIATIRSWVSYVPNWRFNGSFSK